jgi:hypothetical protein
MTENINNSDNNKINSGTKKIGFVVDLNISRVLNTCLDYNVYKKVLSVEQKISYLVENNLINIDADLFQEKENKTKLVEKLLQIWKSDPVNNLKILLKRIEENNIDVTQYNFLNVDVQGYELEVLKGFGDLLQGIDYVYAEVNTNYLYEGCALVGDLDEYLSNYGFTRVLTSMTVHEWGDALYIKK